MVGIEEVVGDDVEGAVWVDRLIVDVGSEVVVVSRRV